MSALIHRRCPVCNGSSSHDWGAKGELRLVQCAACGMVCANPVDADLASGRFYDRLSTALYLSPDKLASDYAPARFERELRVFRRYVARGSVLDVGCSTGGFLHQLRQLGDYQVTGTDVVEEALTHAERQGVAVIRGSFLTHDFATRHFDAITFWAVLEHLVEPGPFLRRATGLLAPGGHLFILVPNLESLAMRCCGLKYRYVMPDHVNYFSAHTLRALARQQPELEEITQHSSHFNPVVIWQDLRRTTLTERVPDAERVALLKRTTAWKQSRWLSVVRPFYRTLEACLIALGLGDNLILVLRRAR